MRLEIVGDVLAAHGLQTRAIWFDQRAYPKVFNSFFEISVWRSIHHRRDKSASSFYFFGICCIKQYSINEKVADAMKYWIEADASINVLIQKRIILNLLCHFIVNSNSLLSLPSPTSPSVLPANRVLAYLPHRKARFSDLDGFR